MEYCQQFLLIGTKTDLTGSGKSLESNPNRNFFPTEFDCDFFDFSKYVETYPNQNHLHKKGVIFQSTRESKPTYYILCMAGVFVDITSTLSERFYGKYIFA